MVRPCLAPSELLLYSEFRLGDLREGRCEYGFFYNAASCCAGMDGERLPSLVAHRLISGSWTR